MAGPGSLQAVSRFAGEAQCVFEMSDSFIWHSASVREEAEQTVSRERIAGAGQSSPLTPEVLVVFSRLTSVADCNCRQPGRNASTCLVPRG